MLRWLHDLLLTCAQIVVESRIDNANTLFPATTVALAEAYLLSAQVELGPNARRLGPPPKPRLFTFIPNRKRAAVTCTAFVSPWLAVCPACSTSAVKF